jgi:hypothetical protein
LGQLYLFKTKQQLKEQEEHAKRMKRLHHMLDRINNSIYNLKCMCRRERNDNCEEPKEE